MKDLQNNHSGKLCFIYGAGPSLNNVNDEGLSNYINITVNSGFIKNPNCDFFVSDDSAITNWNYYNSIWRSHCKKLLFRDRFESICDGKKDVIFYEHTWWFSPKDKKYNLDGLKLTKDGPIVGARTSVGSAVHLAYIMSCNPIVLLGNDCRIINRKRYYWQYFSKKQQPYRIKGTTFNERTQNIGFSEKDFVEYWNKFAKVNKKIIGKDVDIIDCSDSNLRCFPKMNLKEVLDKYGDKYE
jgi:hypothetical protein